MRASTVLACLLMGLGMAGCPRRPIADPSCRNGQTRCYSVPDAAASAAVAQVCHAGGWYPVSPVRDECPPPSVCCLHAAPYDAGMQYACASRWRCVAPVVDASVPVDGAHDASDAGASEAAPDASAQAREGSDLGGA